MAGGTQPKPAVGDGYLVARAQEGYLDAYEILVQRHSAMAFRVALRLCGNHHDAQEAPIAAWENLARFRAGSSFSTWLYQIVTRRTLNKVTCGRGAGLVDLLDEAADPITRPAAQGGRNLAVDAVTNAVVVLHHFAVLSYAEVAEVTLSTVPAVRSHLFRARRTLGAKLEEWR